MAGSAEAPRLLRETALCGSQQLLGVVVGPNKVGATGRDLTNLRVKTVSVLRTGLGFGSIQCTVRIGNVAFPDLVLRDRIRRRDGLEANRGRCLRIVYLNGIQDRNVEASMVPVRVPSAMSEGNSRATAARPWFASVNHGR
jgi:hypothetical protein